MDPKRSATMARIRSRDTGPELYLRRALWAEGLRYRVNHKTPAGKPDIVFPARRLTVFVDGCFWHGCPDHYVRPRSRTDFWDRKLRSNVERDRSQTLCLEGSGWQVLRFWEHNIFTNPQACVAAVRVALTDSPSEGCEDWRVVAVEPTGRDRERRVLESLRNSDLQVVQERKRSTKKW
ncbi:very short patch repair endonuclease [Gemmatimonadota bacterium]